MKRAVTVLLGCLIPLSVVSTELSADQTETTTMNLGNAVDYGLHNNLDLKQAEKAAEVAKFQMNEAFASLYLPTVAATGTFTYLDPETVDNANSMYSVQTRWQDNYSAALKISKPLFAGFTLRTSYSLQKWNYELALKSLDDKKKQVRYTITQNFYNLFLLQESVKLYEELDRQLKQTVDYTRANYNAGLASDYDLIKAQVAWQNNQPVLQKMRNSYDTAKLSFCQTLGMESDTNVAFVGSLWEATNLCMPEGSGDELTALALSNEMNLTTLRYTLKTYELSLKLAQGQRLPSVSAYFSAGEDYSRNTDALDPARVWTPSWTLGVTVSVPIDGWIPISSQAEAIRTVEANREKTQIAIRAYEQNIRLQVFTLVKSITQSAESMNGSQASANQSKRGLDIANKQYRAGLISSLEVTSAEVTYQESKMAYLQAVYEYINSILALDRLIGKDDYCDQISGVQN